MTEAVEELFELDPAAKIVSKARIRRTPAAEGIKRIALPAQPAEYARRHIRT